METTLLPPNATALEEAVDKAGGQALDLSAPLRLLWRPDEVPSEWLPWMAWGLSADLWSSDWAEAKRRNVVARSYELHRRKGTLAGIRETTRIGGGELINAVTPPAKTFAAPTWTEQAREQWLSKHPELRIFRHRDRGQRAGAMPIPGIKPGDAKVYLQPNTRNTPPASPVTGDTYRVGPSPTGDWADHSDEYTIWDGAEWTFQSSNSPAALHHGTAYPSLTTAPQRVRPRVFTVQPDGSERELTAATFNKQTESTQVVSRERSAAFVGTPQADRTFEIVSPGLRAKGAMIGPVEAPVQGKLFAGGARRYLADKRAFRRVYITTIVDELDIQTRQLARHTVQPLRNRTDVGRIVEEGEAISARAETVAQAGQRRGTMLGTAHPGRYQGDATPHGYLAQQQAGVRMFRRTHLFDPDVPLPTSGRSFHLGAMRLGMPPYNAELGVRYQRRRRTDQTWRHVRGHIVARPHDDLQRLYRALRWSKSERDRILVTTQTRRPASVGVDVLAGEATAGEWIGG